jgi:hypothetical protein
MATKFNPAQFSPVPIYPFLWNSKGLGYLLDCHRFAQFFQHVIYLQENPINEFRCYLLPFGIIFFQKRYFFGRFLKNKISPD